MFTTYSWPLASLILTDPAQKVWGLNPSRNLLLYHSRSWNLFSDWSLASACLPRLLVRPHNAHTSTTPVQCVLTRCSVGVPGKFHAVREAFHSKKQRNLWISPKWWWPPPPSGVGTFLNLGLYWNQLTPPPKINLGLFWTWDFFDAEWPPKNSSKQVEYKIYWYKINQYGWYNGIFDHV